MAYDLKITIFNNKDYEQEFTLLSNDVDPFDFTGYKFIFAVANQEKTLIAQDSSSPSNTTIVVLNASQGRLKLVLPYTLLKTLKPANYLHELIMIDNVGKRSSVWTGQMIVKRGIA